MRTGRASSVTGVSVSGSAVRNQSSGPFANPLLDRPQNHRPLIGLPHLIGTVLRNSVDREPRSPTPVLRKTRADTRKQLVYLGQPDDASMLKPCVVEASPEPLDKRLAIFKHFMRDGAQGPGLTRCARLSLIVKHTPPKRTPPVMFMRLRFYVTITSVRPARYHFPLYQKHRSWTRHAEGSARIKCHLPRSRPPQMPEHLCRSILTQCKRGAPFF